MISKKERFRLCINYFMEQMPAAETELRYKDPYQLLVAVILSAQCTDKRVNMITPAFFDTFPAADSLAVAEIASVFERIKSCTYPNNKAKNLIGMAQVLTNRFGGIVPSNVDELQLLPGVGRKTANVIASVVYNKPVMAVDTHVFRVSARIGLTYGSKSPLDTERQLVKYIPKRLIPLAHHWLILHGRYICKARKPKCAECGLQSFCRYYLSKNNLEL